MMAPAYITSCPSDRASEEGRAEGGTTDIMLHVTGPLFSILAVPECVGLPEPQFSAGMHAARQIPAGPPLPPCQHLPGKRSALDTGGEEEHRQGVAKV